MHLILDMRTKKDGKSSFIEKLCLIGLLADVKRQRKGIRKCILLLKIIFDNKNIGIMI